MYAKAVEGGSAMQDELSDNLISSGADLVGFAGIAEGIERNGASFGSAVSIGIAYDPSVVKQLNENVRVFHEHLLDTKERMRELVVLAERFLSERGCSTWTPEISKTLPNLTSDFSHKTAATRAGLGWVGKNALFVSKAHGCGIRLATILTNAPLSPGTPVVTSSCGRCRRCVEACPCHAITGSQWEPGIGRDALLDADRCKRWRDGRKALFGFADPCGLCIQACPFGC